MLTISEIPLPDTVDDAWRDYQRIGHAHNHELVGGPQWDVSDEASLAAAHADSEHEVHRYLAYLDGVAVGYANTRVNLVDSPDKANVYICVLPNFRAAASAGQSPNASSRRLPATPSTRRGPCVPFPGPTTRPSRPRPGPAPCLLTIRRSDSRWPTGSGSSRWSG